MDYLLNIRHEVLFDCIKDYLRKSGQTIIPDFLMNIVDVSSDGSCQLRAISHNINTLKNEKKSVLKMAENMYSKLKETVLNLPTLSNEELMNDYSFVEIDPDLTPEENINNLIAGHHGPEINNLAQYKRKFKYGTYTTNFELRLLLSKPLAEYWFETFEIPTPCISVYIKKRGVFIEQTCLNRESFIDFRILYVNSIHYECLYLKEEYDNYFYQFLKDNGCRIK